MIGQNIIGSRPCEVAVNRILQQPEFQRYSTNLLRHWNKFRLHMRKLRHHLKVQDLQFYDEIMKLVRVQYMTQVDAMKDRLPKVVFTHYRCCMVANFRAINQEIKEAKRHVSNSNPRRSA